MDFYDKLELDKRYFKKRFFDFLKSDNLIFSILLRKSIIFSLFIRLYILLLAFMGDFAFNTFFIHNDFILNIHKTKQVKLFIFLKNYLNIIFIKK